MPENQETALSDQRFHFFTFNASHNRIMMCCFVFVSGMIVWIARQCRCIFLTFSFPRFGSALNFCNAQGIVQIFAFGAQLDATGVHCIYWGARYLVDWPNNPKHSDWGFSVILCPFSLPVPIGLNDTALHFGLQCNVGEPLLQCKLATGPVESEWELWQPKSSDFSFKFCFCICLNF